MEYEESRLRSYEESQLRSYKESQLCSYKESRLHLWNTKKADCVHDHLVRVDALMIRRL